MKLIILGEGGVRFAFLAKSLAYNAHRIGSTEVVFLGNSAGSLAIFGEIARYVFNTIRSNIQFSTTTNPVAALQDANYTITTLRVGGDENHIRDERIVLQYSALDQETISAGGFAMAVRPIPAVLRYCRLIEEHAAEDAILFNFTNPLDLVTETIVRSGFKHRAYGICDTPSELIRELPAVLDCEEHDLSVECYGLSHFSWFTHFTVHGEEVTKRLIASPGPYQKTAMQYFSSELVRLYGSQLLSKHLYYYYYQKVALKAIQEAGEVRGEQIARINQEMREALCTVDTRTQPEAIFTIWIQHYLCQESSCMQNESQQEKFHTREPLTLRQFIEEPGTNGYAGVALDILETVNSTTTKCIVVSIQNHDALDFLRPDGVIEIGCNLSRGGLKPVTSMKMPTAQKNMASYVKEYERLAVVAILQQDKSLVVRALMVHPLIGPYSLAKTLVKTYLDDEQFAAWR